MLPRARAQTGPKPAVGGEAQSLAHERRGVLGPEEEAALRQSFTNHERTRFWDL